LRGGEADEAIRILNTERRHRRAFVRRPWIASRAGRRFAPPDGSQ